MSARPARAAVGAAVRYTPVEGRAGDTIPFHDGQRWHVFYLREVVRGTTSWFHLVSADGAIWEELGEAIPVGLAEDQDASVATGSIIERDGVFHAFTTGYSFARKRAGAPEQGVLHATSSDLISWTKDADFQTLLADPAHYEAHDWRDPFVFWNDQAGEYWMLVAGRLPAGPVGRRGVLARYRSDDLVHWRLSTPFWAPGQTNMLECPDLFRWGDWWYLLFSTFDDRQITRYRMAPSPDGPWLAPADDALDDDGLYAAKTMTDGHRRLLVGWIPGRSGTDHGDWQWGGTLVTHELHQRADGRLAVGIPAAVVTALGAHRPASIEPRLGAWTDLAGTWRVDSRDGFAWAWAGALPAHGSVRLRVTAGDDVLCLGVGFRIDEEFEEGYLVRVRPALARLEFDGFPRAAPAGNLHERPLEPGSAGQFELQLAWDEETVAVVLDGVALTARTHRVGGGLGFFVQQGHAAFEVLGDDGA